MPPDPSSGGAPGVIYAVGFLIGTLGTALVGVAAVIRALRNLRRDDEP